MQPGDAEPALPTHARRGPGSMRGESHSTSICSRLATAQKMQQGQRRVRRVHGHRLYADRADDLLQESQRARADAGVIAEPGLPPSPSCSA